MRVDELDINKVFPENNARLSLNDSASMRLYSRKNLLSEANPSGVDNLIDKYKLTDFKSADVICTIYSGNQKK